MRGEARLKARQALSRQTSYVVLGAALILLLPLAAMQFGEEVKWNWFDFALIGALLVGTGVTYLLAARLVGTTRYRLVLGIGLAAVLLLVWAELAVGVFGSPFAGS